MPEFMQSRNKEEAETETYMEHTWNQIGDAIVESKSVSKSESASKSDSVSESSIRMVEICNLL